MPTACFSTMIKYSLREGIAQTIYFAMHSFQLQRNRNSTKQYYKTHFFLTFKNPASYISDGRTATLQMLHFIYFF
jgi:hypothetical protein